ncbi:MAG: IS3 family transposase [Desulfobacterales bacterium]|nr:IS3 family transposase [Desulfobacterales bacterium]
MKRKRKNYTDEFKEEAVKLVTEQGYTISKASKNLGIHESLLRRWKNEFEPNSGSQKSKMADIIEENKQLKKKNRQLELEREIFKKGGGLLCERAELRYQFIDTERKTYPLILLCKVMKVSRSGFYSWKSRGKSRRQKERERLIPKVKEIHRQTKGSYGARRIAEELESQGESCKRTKAATLMNLAGIEAKQKKKFKATTDSKHNLPIAPNLLNRNFEVDAPDSVYCSDITYIWTTEGWLYLAVVIDLFSRQVVGWSMNNRMTKELVINALRMAIWRRRPEEGCIFHSDRGSQYCSHDFQKELKDNGMISSMSRKGNCWDNSVAESFFGKLKTERVYDSTYSTREKAKRDIVDYIEMFYNSKRRHSYLGYLSPKEFEEMMLDKKAA